MAHERKWRGLLLLGAVLMSAQGQALTTTPGLTTITGGTMMLGSGSTLTDAAILSEGNSPSGLMTFELFDPSNVLFVTFTEVVSGNGIYVTPGLVPATAGTWTWTDSYSGDSRNNGVTSLPELESVILTAPGLTLTTATGGTVILGSGSSLTDAAILSGGISPSGLITFELFDPSNVLFATFTDVVSGNGIYVTPSGFLPSTAGTWTWMDSYSGDPNNSGTAAAAETERLVQPSTTPEPSSMALMCLGVAGLAFYRRLLKKA